MDLNTPEFARVFREELEERSSRLVSGGRRLADKTLEAATIPDLVRDAHTIKGSAGLLGHTEIKEAAAVLEGLWRKVGEGHSPPPEAADAMVATAEAMTPALVASDVAELVDLVSELAGDSGWARRPGTVRARRPGTVRARQPGTVRARQPEPADTVPAHPLEKAETVPGSQPEPAEVVPAHPPEPGDLGGLLSSVSESMLGGATRVDIGDLYRLINRIVEAALDADALADLSLVSIEGDDPDLFRKSWRGQVESLSEAVHDISDQAVSLANGSFFDAVVTFPQFVRYLGRRLGKDIRFELAGKDVQLDRQIVDLIREPIRHLLVNAADHGVEPAADRLVAGKPSAGTIVVGAAVNDDCVEVYVSDDGAGVDWEAVAEGARKAGAGETGPELKQLLFHPGFSTASKRSEFSGAGDGLPAVLAAVETVHGAVHLESTGGSGVVVTMTLPLSMALQNVVVVAVGDQFWGLPEASVKTAMALSNAELTSTESGVEVRFNSGAVPCVSLAEAVGADRAPDESELLVVNTRSGLVAVTVSELVDRRRVAVKNLGPILEGAGHVTGAALLGGGSILVVLDPNFLGAAARRRPRLVNSKPRVLVVDDSAGARQLLAAVLNGAGLDVESASSAREAMSAAGSRSFDAMVVDYSMPRSNGVELVRAMRASGVRMPIVMVSGVASAEEKEAAWEAGVDAYFDKYDLRQGVLTKTLIELMGLEEANLA